MSDDSPLPASHAPSAEPRGLGATLRRYRLVIIWIVLLLGVSAIDIATVLADAKRQGRTVDVPWVVVLEGSSHLMLGVLIPLLYGFHRRFPVIPVGRNFNLLVHLALSVPYSAIHVLGMFAMRWMVAPLVGRTYAVQLNLDTLLYEYRKDIVTYLIFSAALLAFRYALAPEAGPAASPPAQPVTPPAQDDANDTAGPTTERLERFAVRRKDKEILVSAQDIAWIEAAGNYAILHVGGETYDIRSSLSRLEAELDPARFVRVHKSYIVNVARVREVEPWISGDSRLKLDDGAVVSLSRRYRPRFEKIVPIRT